MSQFSAHCLSVASYLEMSSDTRDEGEVPHYAYRVLRIFPPFPAEIAVLCHHAETNDMFLHGGRVGPSPFTKMNRGEIFQLENLVSILGFDNPLIHLVPYICIRNRL